MELEIEEWLTGVESALNEINMSIRDWQPAFPYDFHKAFADGLSTDEAAVAAIEHWWKEQAKVYPGPIHRAGW
jgi:hypothetical protein